MTGKTKIAGIQIHDTRMMRLTEVLLHGGTQLNGWRSADIHQASLTTFGLSAGACTRKMKAHTRPITPFDRCSICSPRDI